MVGGASAERRTYSAPRAHAAEQMQNQRVITTPALMTWREDDQAGLVGYVADGSVPLFTVHWTTDINDIGSGQSLLVRSTLPGFESFRSAT